MWTLLSCEGPCIFFLMDDDTVLCSSLLVLPQTQHLLSELANTVLHTSDTKEMDTKVFLTSSLQTRPDVKVSNHENRSAAWCPA